MTLPNCLNCKYYKGKWRCKAFSKGIPEEIVLAQNDHTEPYEGDNGIQFEPIEK